MNYAHKAFRKLRRLSARPVRLFHRLEGRLKGQPCPVCGCPRVNKHRPILSNELVSVWELSPEWRNWFDDREGTFCPICESNMRSQFMAASLVTFTNDQLGLSCTCLRDTACHPDFHQWRVAEFNACGQLHRWLARHPGLDYSEYKAKPPVRSENLLNLSYENKAFDLILTSETLEHVPDLKRALSEIFRVLKPGGSHIFTVPVVWDRPHSRICAELDEQGNLTMLRAASFHGMAGTTANDMMVITEFGSDIIAQLEAAGFITAVDRDPTNPALCTFITRRPHEPETATRND